MKVYTKTGDQGMTSLLSRQRVPKDHLRVETYGTVDEANAAIGLAKSLLSQPQWAHILDNIQQELISLNADLATEGELPGQSRRITSEHISGLEATIDNLEGIRIPQKYFVTPGACPAGAALDLARTTVRRAERCAVRLGQSAAVSEQALIYLNRLSDLLFVLARCVEQQQLIAVVTRRVLTKLGGGEMKMDSETGLLAKAKQAIAAAEDKAREIGVPMVIAVVDKGGNLVGHHRMDGALLVSVSLALDKAFTAVALKMPTAQLAELTQPGRELYGLSHAAGGRVVVFGGGLPIVREGQLVGGLGVSGGSVEQDIAVAEAGLNAWQ